MNYTPRIIEFNPPRPSIDLHIKKTDARKELDAKKQEHARAMWHKLIEKRNAEEKRLQEVRA